MWGFALVISFSLAEQSFHNGEGFREDRTAQKTQLQLFRSPVLAKEVAVNQLWAQWNFLACSTSKGSGMPLACHIVVGSP